MVIKHFLSTRGIENASHVTHVQSLGHFMFVLQLSFPTGERGYIQYGHRQKFSIMKSNIFYHKVWVENGLELEITSITAWINDIGQIVETFCLSFPINKMGVVIASS